jgi:hypothetical protein
MFMTCLTERIVCAMLLALGESAFAQSIAFDSSEAMTVANIAPMPVEPLPSIPEPQRYVRNEMEFRTNQQTLNETKGSVFYSAEIAHEFRIGTIAPVTPEASKQQPPSFLRQDPSTAPKLSIVELPNATLTVRAQPQRRLSLTVDDWVFSATARIAVLHSHNTGMTFNVRHGF